jgi:hypothetical protein
LPACFARSQVLADRRGFGKFDLAIPGIGGSDAAAVPA